MFSIPNKTSFSKIGSVSNTSHKYPLINLFLIPEITAAGSISLPLAVLITGPKKTFNKTSQTF